MLFRDITGGYCVNQIISNTLCRQQVAAGGTYSNCTDLKG
jgi:hypothetical protein